MKGKPAEVIPPKGGEKNGEANGSENPKAKTGHNENGGLTDEQLHALTRNVHMPAYKKCMEEIKKAKDILDDKKKDLLDLGKIVKADLGVHGIEDIQYLIQIETAEGEKRAKAELERKARLARWANLPFSFQGSMFEEVDRRPATEKAEADGYRVGLDGGPRKPPHDPSLPQYGSWMAGFDRAQALLMEGFKKLEPKPEPDMSGLADAPTPPAA